MTKQINSEEGTYIFPFTATSECAISDINAFSTESSWVTLSLGDNNTSLIVRVDANNGTAFREAEIYPIMNGVTCADNVLTLLQMPGNVECNCDSAYISLSNLYWNFNDTSEKKLQTFLSYCHSLEVTSNETDSHFEIEIVNDGILFTPKTNNCTNSNIVENVTIKIYAEGTSCVSKTYTITLTHNKSSLQEAKRYKDIKVAYITQLSKETGCTVIWTYTEVDISKCQETTETTGLSAYTTIPYQNIQTEFYKSPFQSEKYFTFGFDWKNHIDYTTGKLCHIEFINNEDFKIGRAGDCHIGIKCARTGSTSFPLTCYAGRTNGINQYNLYVNDNINDITNIDIDDAHNYIVAAIAPNPNNESRTLTQDIIAEYTYNGEKRIAVVIDDEMEQS